LTEPNPFLFTNVVLQRDQIQKAHDILSTCTTRKKLTRILQTANLNYRQDKFLIRKLASEGFLDHGDGHYLTNKKGRYMRDAIKSMYDDLEEYET